MASKRMSKTQFVAAVAEKSGLSKKQTNAALEAISKVITRELGKKGPGEVVLPGLVKLSLVIKPATPAARGCQPLHQSADDLQGKAGAQGGQDPRPQDAHRRGLRLHPFGGRLRPAEACRFGLCGAARQAQREKDPFPG